jgi:Fe-S-cluster containining protein
MLKYQLPEIYRKLLDFSQEETKATCANCAMAQSPKGKVSYKADLKCCTFEPFIPNYLVGAILESKQTSTGAREAILLKIKKRQYALPIGLVADIPFQIRFQEKGPKDFGNREDLLCPYFNKDLNNCGIWKNRGSVCSSFFCKSDSGQKGLKFWNDLGDYLNLVEMALLEEILAHLDFSPRQVNENLDFLNRKTASLTELKSKSLPLLKAKKLWNGYFEDQEKFYRKCYELALGLDRKNLKQTMGSMGENFENSLFAQMEKLK